MSKYDQMSMEMVILRVDRDLAFEKLKCAEAASELSPNCAKLMMRNYCFNWVVWELFLGQ